MRFLTKWRLDLGSLGRLESIGMLEIFGHRSERILSIFVKIMLCFRSFEISETLEAISEIFQRLPYICNFERLRSTFVIFGNMGHKFENFDYLED